jgi:hypothetical protein
MGGQQQQQPGAGAGYQFAGMPQLQTGQGPQSFGAPGGFGSGLTYRGLGFGPGSTGLSSMAGLSGMNGFQTGFAVPRLQ